MEWMFSIDFAERNSEPSLDNGDRVTHRTSVEDFLPVGIQFAQGNEKVNISWWRAVGAFSRARNSQAGQDMSCDLQARGRLV